MSLATRVHSNLTWILLLYGYGVQLYAAILSLAFAPYILQRIGPEAYGLVGVFLIMQAVFQLLDAGMTPALTRETARYQGGAVDDDKLSLTIRGLESVVGVTAMPVLAVTFLMSSSIASHWVQRESLTIEDVSIALNLIMLILLLRWVSGIRRGVLVGFECHFTLYTLTAILATLRFPAIIVYFLFVEPSSTSYFLYQLAASLLEAIALWLFSQRRIPKGPAAGLLIRIRALRGIAGFAINHGFLAVIWILITQTDKILLSKLLTLSQFGYFSLAVAAASGVNLIVIPISQMLMPKLSRLMAEGDVLSMRRVYSRATRTVSVFLSVVTAMFACFGQPIMLAWTGDQSIAVLVGQVLAWYSIGNAAMSIGAFSYYLQYASGNLRLHTWGTIGMLVLFMPTVWITIKWFGMIGAAITWAMFWLVYLVTWVTITHCVVLDGRHWQWLFNDVLRTFVPVGLLGICLRAWLPLSSDRTELVLTLIAYGAIMFVTSLACSGLLQSMRFPLWWRFSVRK